AASYLYGSGATQQNWVLAISNVKPTHVCGVGHGDEETYTGYRLESLMWVGCPDANIPLSAECFILSCRTAAKLGPWVVEKGVVGYLGWSADYVFWVNYGQRKGEGTVDRYFLGPIEANATAWILGQKTLAKAASDLKEYYYSEARSGRWPPDVASTFWWDAEYLTYISRAPAEKITYIITLTLPDGRAVTLAEGEAPYPQPQYTVTVAMPESGPEGDGALTVAATYKEMKGSSTIPVKLAVPPAPTLKVEIVEPAPGSTLHYGRSYSVVFKVSVE
ncbi:MAG: hypothetical protein QW407_06620, partial [Thermofilaceae archaeon]